MDKLIKELLAVPEGELLHHEKVVAAYWGLKGKKHHTHELYYMVAHCYKCGTKLVRDCIGGPARWEDTRCPIPDDIPGSLADVAFEIRWASDYDAWEQQLNKITTRAGEEPKHWVIAATLAWWEGQGS